MTFTLDAVDRAVDAVLHAMETGGRYRIARALKKVEPLNLADVVTELSMRIDESMVQLGEVEPAHLLPPDGPAIVSAARDRDMETLAVILCTDDPKETLTNLFLVASVLDTARKTKAIR